jgi:hypothetical protein
MIAERCFSIRLPIAPMVFPGNRWESGQAIDVGEDGQEINVGEDGQADRSMMWVVLEDRLFRVRDGGLPLSFKDDAT